MAFVVEDGTGKADANSYASVAEYKAFATSWGWDYSALTDEQIEQYLVQGTSFTDRQVSFVGYPTNEEQALEWPRSGAYDCYCRAISSTTIPKGVKEAVYFSAHYVSTGGNLFIVSSGKDIIEEKVDVISVKYSDRGFKDSGYISIPQVDNALKPYNRFSMCNNNNGIVRV